MTSLGAKAAGGDTQQWRFGCICGTSGEWRDDATDAINEGIAHEDLCHEVSWDIVEKRVGS